MSDLFRRIFRDYKEISVRYDKKTAAVWCYYKPRKRPCFSTTLLKEAKAIQNAIIKYFEVADATPQYPIHYLVLASQTPGIFSLGGDLDLFVELIMARKREELLQYAKSCIDICYMNAVNLHLPITTISLVSGSALGGGFESALSSNVLIAEKNSQMGLPEIRFNLFPGMGAYSFLARNLGEKLAEKMLTSGKIYSAEELHKVGVIDVLAEPGQGLDAVNRYIKKHSVAGNGLRAIRAVKQFYNPIIYDELLGITEIWVDAALRLTDKDLRTMRRLVVAQTKKILPSQQARGKKILRTFQDRRFDSSQVSFPFTDIFGQYIPRDRRGGPRRRTIDPQLLN